MAWYWWLTIALLVIWISLEIATAAVNKRKGKKNAAPDLDTLKSQKQSQSVTETDEK